MVYPRSRGVDTSWRRLSCAPKQLLARAPLWIGKKYPFVLVNEASFDSFKPINPRIRVVSGTW